MNKSLNKVWTRIQNKKVASAVVAGTLLILVNIGVIDVGMSAKIEAMVETALGVLVTLGIFSNPESHVNNAEVTIDIPSIHVEMPKSHMDSPTIHVDSPEIHVDFQNNK